MQVTYRTTLEDYVAFSRHVLRKSSVLWAIYLLGWLLPAAIAFGIGVVLVAIDDLWPIGLCVIAGDLLYAAIYPSFYRIWFEAIIRAYARQMGTRGVLGQITLILTDSSFVEITETTRSEVRWQDIHGVDVVGDYTFIFVTSLLAAILPRHGFDSDAEYETVRDFALARMGSHARRERLGRTYTGEPGA